jgi:ectoine hydroxylase-related dioxygenase (phytanoyl-CoA dioxygenase family)
MLVDREQGAGPETGSIRFEGEYPDWLGDDVVKKKFTPLETKAGTAVLLHGENVHYSAPNLSPVSRHAYSVHFIDQGVASWDDTNWLRRKEGFPFEPL